jgi:hypothetical protein
MLTSDKIVFWLIIPLSTIYACLAGTEVVLLSLPSWIADFLFGFPLVAGLICYGLCFQWVKIHFYPGANIKLRDCLQVVGFVILPGSIVALICFFYFLFRNYIGYIDETDQRLTLVFGFIWIFQVISVFLFALLRLRFRIAD